MKATTQALSHFSGVYVDILYVSISFATSPATATLLHFTSELARFKNKIKTTKQIQIVLVSIIPIKKTMYSEEIITRNITLMDLMRKG